MISFYKALIGLICFLVLTGVARGGDETALEPPENQAVVEPTPDPALPVTFFWKPLMVDSDFEPEDGEIYEITLKGEDRSNLRLIFKRLKPYQGDVRICVQSLNTQTNLVLLDQKNQGLFPGEEGEFVIDVKNAAPSGWPIYLVEFTDDPYANPKVLSNIIELP